MNKTRYPATEIGRNKPMNFRPSGTLRSIELLAESKILKQEGVYMRLHEGNLEKCLKMLTYF